MAAETDTTTNHTVPSKHKTIHHPKPVNLASTQSKITQPWTPQHILTVNSSHSFKLATITGSFIWHSHPETDELFYIVSGGPLFMDIAVDEGTKHENEGYETVKIGLGEVFNVRTGWRHRPWVDNETGILMVEKVGTVNTGDEAEGEEGRRRTVAVREDGGGGGDV